MEQSLEKLVSCEMFDCGIRMSLGPMLLVDNFSTRLISSLKLACRSSPGDISCWSISDLSAIVVRNFDGEALFCFARYWLNPAERKINRVIAAAGPDVDSLHLLRIVHTWYYYCYYYVESFHIIRAYYIMYVYNDNSYQNIHKLKSSASIIEHTVTIKVNTTRRVDGAIKCHTGSSAVWDLSFKKKKTQLMWWSIEIERFLFLSIWL